MTMGNCQKHSGWGAMVKAVVMDACLVVIVLSLRLLAAERGALFSERYSWLNQKVGPRPEFVWENREDLIYHDLDYGPELNGAPEFAWFIGRVWVFNRAMRWERKGLDGALVCYSAAGDLALTGEKQVSAWHSDHENEVGNLGENTVFVKKSVRRRWDCAVLPAFQFHLGQHPRLVVRVAEADADWQFCVSMKGRSGPPLVSSGWRRGPGEFTCDLAEAMRERGYTTHFAELHFVMGLWTASAEAAGKVVFDARLLGQPAVVSSLPVIRTVDSVQKNGLPICAVVLDEKGERLGSGRVKVEARLDGRAFPLEESTGIWRTSVRDLKPKDYTATVSARGVISSETTLQVRVTDGQFDRYDEKLWQIARGGKPTGPLTGSFQGTFFFRDVGSPDERMVNGQNEWDAWDRSKAPGEHMHYWEALTERELDQRFAHLSRRGWDLLHICSHWGIWVRMDAGGRISPHGAER